MVRVGGGVGVEVVERFGQLGEVKGIPIEKVTT